MAEVIEISRVALHDQLVARLRTMLVEDRIPPGAKLNERELSEQLRVSRTPLREAIKLLAAEGLVDLLPNRGAIAVRLTERDVLDTFEVLAELEGLSGALAAVRITERQLEEMRALQYERMACFTRHDLSGYYRLNATIHCLINDAAGNSVLSGTYRSINARVQSLRFRTNQNGTKWKRAIQDHEDMVEAMSARDADAMRTILVRHIRDKSDTVLDLMRAGALAPIAQHGT
jgi:DNA-binding GntR family transcriptional regulator